MKALVIAVALLAACEGNPDPFPVHPGGGGSGMEGSADAAVDSSGDASATITGRVCVISDPRSPVACATSGVGVTVTLGTETTLTADNGAFTIMRPPGTNVWRVSGNGIEPSAMALSDGTTIPAIDSLIYGDMIAAVQPIVAAGNGALIMQVRKANVLVAGAVATPQPAPDSETYYDGASVIEWSTVQTGAFGVVWVPSIVTGTAQVTVNDGAPHIVSGIPIFADTITFVFAEIP